MHLAIKSDASYLSISKAWLKAAKYFYLTSNVPSTSPTSYNGVIHVFWHVMPEVLSFATEAKLVTLFHNSKALVHSTKCSSKWDIHILLQPLLPTTSLHFVITVRVCGYLLESKRMYPASHATVVKTMETSWQEGELLNAFICCAPLWHLLDSLLAVAFGSMKTLHACSSGGKPSTPNLKVKDSLGNNSTCIASKQGHCSLHNIQEALKWTTCLVVVFWIGRHCIIAHFTFTVFNFMVHVTILSSTSTTFATLCSTAH